MSPGKCRKLVAARARGACERCAKESALTLHHRKKRSQGGGWTPGNCVMLCGHGTRGCHGWVEDHPTAAEAEGWHVRPWDDPGSTPVLYHGSGLCYLTEDGEHEWRQDSTSS